MEVKGTIIRGGSSVEDDLDLRRGPWTVDEDLTIINYIATHGEGRWNSLARSAGLKRTGKSCRLRWLNYLRPDVRRGNITLEEQLLILELHSRWGNRWSKIAQYLPGRTDNEIKNYWRTRVQKHAKQLKCDVNSKQFKDTMRYLWMPRLVERIQAAATTGNNLNNNMDQVIENNNTSGGENMLLPIINNINSSHLTQPNYTYTPENSGTAASSDSFGTTSQVSPLSDFTTTDHYNQCNYGAVPTNSNNYYHPSHIAYDYSDCITSPYANLLPPHELMDYSQQPMEPNTPSNHNNITHPPPPGDTFDNFWNVDNMLFLQHHLNIDTM